MAQNTGAEVLEQPYSEHQNQTAPNYSLHCLPFHQHFLKQNNLHKLKSTFKCQKKTEQNFKNVLSKPYHIENSKTSKQIPQIRMRWLMMSHLIWIYMVCRFNYFRFFSPKNNYNALSHCRIIMHDVSVSYLITC